MRTIFVLNEIELYFKECQRLACQDALVGMQVKKRSTFFHV